MATRRQRHVLSALYTPSTTSTTSSAYVMLQQTTKNGSVVAKQHAVTSSWLMHPP
jgi:hypothetical protein